MPNLKIFPTSLLAGIISAIMMTGFSGLIFPAWSQQFATTKQSHKPDLGLSLFDQLYLNTQQVPGQYKIPYPFGALINDLESHLGISINGDQNIVNSTFIPVGRCIDRNDAFPDFFKYPRAIVAINSEHYGLNDLNKLYLKNKLFLGYQEKSKSMRVISYNDVLGRFEFQTVSNYGMGDDQTVAYSDRESCTVCHQNNGPIFPRALWDETDMNPRIYENIYKANYGQHLEPTTNTPSRVADIDSAINKANMFGLYQTIWRGICDSDSPETEAKCRAGFLEIIVLQRLAQDQYRQPATQLGNRYFSPLAADNINRYWPEGISTESSDIDNRNPLISGIPTHLHSAEQLKRPRTIKIHWRPDNLNRIVRGLGSLMPLVEIRKLDALLYQSARRDSASKSRLMGECRFRRSDQPDLRTPGEVSAEFSFRCEFESGVPQRPFNLLGDLFIDEGKLTVFHFLNRMFLDTSTALIGLSHQGAEIKRTDKHVMINIPLYDSNHRLHARLPSGEIVDRLALKIPNELFFTFHNANKFYSEAGQLELLSESASLGRALNSMVAEALVEEDDTLLAPSFQGERIIKKLNNAIGQFF